MKGKTTMKIGMGAAMAWMLLSAAGAHAHTSLTGSTPADGATLEASPEEIVLTFSEPVRLTARSLEKRGGDGVPLEAPPAERSEQFVAAVPELSPGEYVVSWRVISADTHVVSGEVSFTVAGEHPAGH